MNKTYERETEMRNQLIKTWWQEPLFALVIWFICDFIAYASAHI